MALQMKARLCVVLLGGFHEKDITFVGACSSRSHLLCCPCRRHHTVQYFVRGCGVHAGGTGPGAAAVDALAPTRHPFARHYKDPPARAT